MGIPGVPGLDEEHQKKHKNGEIKIRIVFILSFRNKNAHEWITVSAGFDDRCGVWHVLSVDVKLLELFRAFVRTFLADGQFWKCVRCWVRAT